MDDQLSGGSAAAAAAATAGSSSCCAASPASAIAQAWSPLSLCWALELAPFAASAHGHGAAFDSLLLQCEGEDEGGVAERARIQRFHFAADRQRALLGRLAMRAALATTLGVDAGRLRLSRSAYGKPFVLHPAHAQRRVVFNISHHGQFVVLALEAVVAPEGEGGQLPGGPPPYLPLLGCDVTTCSLPPGADSVAEYFACMQSCFTHNEWSLIRDDTESGASSSEEPTASQRDAAALMRFAWLWSLKESLIKAVGMGLSFDLQHIEFFFSNPTQRSLLSPVAVRFLGTPTFAAVDSATVQSITNSNGPLAQLRPPELDAGLDVSRDIDWSFASVMLADQKHIVTVCRGWRREQSVSEAKSAPLAVIPPVAAQASAFAVARPLQLAHLGHCISRADSTATPDPPHSYPAHQLRVQQLSHEQIIPPSRS